MRKLLVLLLLGLILRLALSVQFYQGDVNNHITWGKDLLLNGSQGIYEREFYFRYGTLTPNYPPIILFLFAVSYGLYQLLGGMVWWLNTNISLFPSNLVFVFQNPNFLPAFLKLPAIFADIGIAYFVYLFCKKWFKSEKWPLVGASLVLFNPAFFYNSALWGQVEALPTFLVLAALYFLLYTQRPLAALLIFTSALLSKQNATVFAPVFFVVFWKKFGVLQMLKSGLASLIFFWLVFFPFNDSNLITFPSEVYWNKILTNSVSDYVTYHAFNFWTLFVGLERIHDSVKFLGGVSYQLWGYIIFATSSFVIWRKLLKEKASDMLTIFSSTLISLSSFLFLTRLHERHLEPTLPFLLLMSVKVRKLIPIFIFVSLFYVINLYHDWWAPRVDFFVNVISNINVIQNLVVLLLIAYLFLWGYYFKAGKSVII